MQAQGSLLQGSMMSNFINIYQTEGTRGLWRVRESVCVLWVYVEKYSSAVILKMGSGVPDTFSHSFIEIIIFFLLSCYLVESDELFCDSFLFLLFLRV